jgi:TolB-like protein
LVAVAVVIAIAGLVYFTSGKADNGDAIGSIAVLPFIDESSDPDAQYINDKIAESLINSLSKLPIARRAA